MKTEEKQTILLVEDEAILAMAEQMALEKYGYRVITAYSGAEAIESVATIPEIALILMDINLGNAMDGTEAAARILEHHNLPIVFLSAHAEKEVVEKTESITSYGYVVKNSGITVLDASIKMAFKLHAAHQAIQRTNERLEQEIVERKHIEAALRESETNYHVLIDHTPDFIYSFDRESRHIAVNQSVCQAMGLPAQEIIGKTHAELGFPDEVVHTWQGWHKQVFDSKAPLEAETTVLMPDGLWHTYEVVLIPIIDERGVVTTIRGCSRDVTVRKQAEVALRTSEQWFRSIYEESPIGIEIYDAEGQLLQANRACRELFGVADIAQIVGFKLFDDPNVSDEDKAKLRRGEAARYQVAFDFEKVRHYHLYETPKSGIIYLDVQITPLGLTSGSAISGYLVQIVDISARRLAEESLRESEARFRFVLDNSLDAAYRRNLQADCYDYISPVVEQVLGWSAEEMNSMDTQTVLELLHPEDAPLVRLEIERTNAACRVAGRVTGRLEYRFRDKHGVYRWVGDTITVLADAEGRPLYRLGMVRNITERKQAEIALRESEERYRLLAENSTDVIWTADTAYRFTYISPAIFRLRGLTPEEAMREALQDTMPPHSLEIVNQAARVRAAAEAEGRYDVTNRFEIEQYHRNGSLVWVEIVTQALFDSQGHKIGYLGVSRDVTARKRIEAQKEAALEALQITLTKYQTLFEAFPLGITVADATGKIVEANAVSERMLGISLDAQRQRTIDAAEWRILRADGTPMPPEDYASTRALKEGRRVENVEMGIVKAQGDVTWISVTATPLPLAGYSLAITYSDITARRLAEDALRESVARYRALSEENAHLLREVNHRVANNLALLDAIIGMELRQTTAEEARSALQDVRGRVHNIAQIHQLLSASSNMRVALEYLVRQTIQEVLAASPLHNRIAVAVTATGAPLLLDSRQVIYVGIILNELVTNSIKHAFQGREHGLNARPHAEYAGRIAVHIADVATADSGRRITLTYRDDGPGWPEEVLRGQRESTGMKLIRLTVRGLDGQLTCLNDGGAVAVCSLHFDTPAGASS